MNRGCTRHPTLPVPLEPRHGGDTRFWGGVGKAVTPCLLVWLGIHWGSCEHPCPCLCPPVEAASAGGWGHHFRGETGQVGDTISGVLWDRTDETLVQGCYRTRQLGVTVSGRSPHVTGRTRGGWAGSAETGGAEGGCLSPHPASTPPAAQGPHAAACPGVHPRNLGVRGGAGCLRAL